MTAATDTIDALFDQLGDSIDSLYAQNSVLRQRIEQLEGLVADLVHLVGALDVGDSAL